MQDVTLRVNGGEFLTLLGPSGSGKTTLLNMVLGAFAPDDGEIFLHGKPITSVPMYKRGIGMVFQNYALFPHMTVAQNIAFPLEMRRAPRTEINDRVSAMLTLVRMTGLERRYPRELSGGQQQRVATARALAGGPPLVLMDEPLGALDKNLREELQDELRSLQRRVGITTLYVTHDQSEAMTMSDRIAIMRNGEVEQLGSPRELFDRPANLFVARFLGGANIFEATVIDISVDTCLMEVEPGLRLVASRPSFELRAAERLSVMIRPERISVGPVGGGPTEVNRWRARVADSVFVGSSTRYGLDLSGGPRLLVHAPVGRGMPSFEPGADVELCWPPGDTHVLRG